MSIPTPGSLVKLMDELVNLERTISTNEQIPADMTIHQYRWRPIRPPDSFPAIWNWLTSDRFEVKDLQRYRDYIAISAFIGIKHVDQDKDMATIEILADAFRDTVDPELNRKPPLNRTATWAMRQGMRLVSQDFAGVAVLAIEFPMEFWLDRQLTQT